MLLWLLRLLLLQQLHRVVELRRRPRLNVLHRRPLRFNRRDALVDDDAREVLVERPQLRDGGVHVRRNEDVHLFHLFVKRSEAIEVFKDVRGSESNCEQDSREM